MLQAHGIVFLTIVMNSDDPDSGHLDKVLVGKDSCLLISISQHVFSW